jgi:hypothetical protein
LLIAALFFGAAFLAPGRSAADDIDDRIRQTENLLHVQRERYNYVRILIEDPNKWVVPDPDPTFMIGLRYTDFIEVVTMEYYREVIEGKEEFDDGRLADVIKLYEELSRSAELDLRDLLPDMLNEINRLERELAALREEERLGADEVPGQPSPPSGQPDSGGAVAMPQWGAEIRYDPARWVSRKDWCTWLFSVSDHWYAVSRDAAGADRPTYQAEGRRYGDAGNECVRSL